MLLRGIYRFAMLGSSLALKGKKLLVFDDGLASKDGHWFEYDKAIVAIHRQLGVEVTILAHKDFRFGGELAEAGAVVRPAIAFSPWSWTPPRGPLARMAARWKLLAPFVEWNGVVQQARLHAAVLEEALAKDAYDCVLHPGALAADFVAWSLVSPKLRARAERIVLSTFMPLGTYFSSGPPAFARKLRYWKWAVKCLKREFAAGRMVMLVDSPRLVEEYRQVAGLEAQPVSSPRAIAHADPDLSSPRTSLVFGSLGAARWEKGIDLFEGAIERLIAQGKASGLGFVIQRNRVVNGPAGQPLPLPPALADADSVIYLTDVLTSQDYDRTLSRIDCMVLPYRRELYHSRSSAVAIEAACAGIPMIYTADTWLSDFVAEQGAGIAVADGDSAALERAMLDMAQDYPAFKALADDRAAVARERNSPERYARAVWGLGG